jgi:ABC-type multidrug transport system fused ATPase/permease subunit
MLRSLTYGKALQNVSAEINAAMPFVQRLQHHLGRFKADAVVDQGMSVGTLGPIVFEDVSFGYFTDQPVLTNITAEIRSREIVGIIGPSGSGKSTLVQLLLGLRSPESGRVLADGRDVAQFSRAEWARKVTFVPQQAHLIAGTIADNIRFYRDDVTHEEIERAARLANLHDDISLFPEGYGREVGEGGGQLSGGQQQRLIIARALVEQPELLVLDEPTSALDVRSESAIRATIEELRDRMTVVIIAHRLSTLDVCDRLMVIQDGRLMGFDTPECLEGSSDFYREALVLSGLR